MGFMEKTKSDKFNVRVPVVERKALKDWLTKNKDLRIRGRVVSESSIIRSMIRWLLKLDKPIDDKAVAELRELKNELSSIGGNLNQLARAYHEGLIKTPINGDEFFAELLSQVKETRRRQHLIVAHLEQGLSTKLSEIIDE